MATRVAYLETEAIIPGRESWASVSIGSSHSEPVPLGPHSACTTGARSHAPRGISLEAHGLGRSATRQIAWCAGGQPLKLTWRNGRVPYADRSQTPSNALQAHGCRRSRALSLGL